MLLEDVSSFSFSSERKKKRKKEKEVATTTTTTTAATKGVSAMTTKKTKVFFLAMKCLFEQFHELLRVHVPIIARVLFASTR